ncbi:hypothetical protein [Sessilibacter sp. MAH2]
MSILNLNSHNLTALYKLDIEVKKYTGKRHQLASEQSVIELIKIAFISPFPTIKAAYQQFIDSLDSNQQEKLNSLGIVLINARKNKQPSNKTWLNRLISQLV